MNDGAVPVGPVVARGVAVLQILLPAPLIKQFFGLSVVASWKPSAEAPPATFVVVGSVGPMANVTVQGVPHVTDAEKLSTTAKSNMAMPIFRPAGRISMGLFVGVTYFTDGWPGDEEYGNAQKSRIKNDQKGHGAGTSEGNDERCNMHMLVSYRAQL